MERDPFSVKNQKL